MNNLIDMPTLKPIPIETKGKSPLVRIWRWITSIRYWEVVEDYEYELPNGPTIVIPKYFRFDGASIPKPLWMILSPTGLLLIPGLIHDYGYRHGYLWALNEEESAFKYKIGADRKDWDRIFWRVGIDVNGVYLVDCLSWLALAIGGKRAWGLNRKRNDEELFPKNVLFQK